MKKNKLKWEKPYVDTWKDVPGFEHMYQVSDYGRVRSLDRYMKVRDFFRKINGRIMKPFKNNNGYYIVDLSKNGKSKKYLINRLVFLSFNDIKTDLHVDHINNIPHDNRLKNLQLLTNRENTVKGVLNRDYSDIGASKDNTGFQSKIYINNTHIYLGHSKDKEYCYELYRTAIEKMDLFDGDHLKFRNLISCIVDENNNFVKASRRSNYINKETSTNIIGVSATKSGQLQCKIYINKTSIYLGSVKNIEDGKRLYQIALENKHLFKGDKKSFKKEIKKLWQL